MDFLASEYDEVARNALTHLQEQAHFLRVLGSFPRNGVLVGPVKDEIEALEKYTFSNYRYNAIDVDALPPPTSKSADMLLKNKSNPLRIGIIGFGTFGQFLAKTFVKNHDVFCISRDDKSLVAKSLGVEYFPFYDINALDRVGCDVILFAVSIISFEEVLRMVPPDVLKGKLVVDVLSVKVRSVVRWRDGDIVLVRINGE